MVAVVLLAVAVTFAAIWLGGDFVISRYVDTRQCSLATADHGEACLKAKEIAIGESNIRITALAMVASVVSTIGLVITLFITARATMAATRATEMGAAALAHSERVAGLEYRPFMVIDQVAKEYQSVDDDQTASAWRLVLRWKNTGKTPAQHVISVISTIATPDPLPADFAFPWTGGMPPPVTVGADSSLHSNGAWIDLDTIQAIIDQKQNFYVYGWIEYQGPTEGERYRTEFASQVWLFFGDAMDKDLKHSTINVTDHNGLDNGCKYAVLTPYAGNRGRSTNPPT
jgi:hypothetical protein